MKFTTFLSALSFEETWATIATLAVIALLLVIFFFVRKEKFTVRALSYGAVTVALSYVLSFIKIPLGAIGTGSVTPASSVPLVFYAFFFGTGAGAVAGILYGLLQFLQNPYFLTPVQFLLDYVLAFSTPMVAGLVPKLIRERKAGLPVAVAVAGVLRLLFHTLAGVFFYMEWKVESLPIFGSTEQMGPFVYSLLYNALYMVPEIIIAVAVATPLARSREIAKLFSGGAEREE